VGRRSPKIEAMLDGRPGGFVTAWNPWSRRHPQGWNRRMNLALQQSLRRLPHWPGRGSGRRWHEEHFLVRGDPRRLLVLARRFRQRAILVVAPPRPAFLVELTHGASPRRIDACRCSRL